MQIYFFSYLSEATVSVVIPNWITHAIFKIFDKTIKICNKNWKLNKRQLYANREKMGIICNKTWNDHRKEDYRNSSFVVVFFYQGFLSRTLTTDITAGEGRGPSFIPHYHFHLLTNIQTLICNFPCEMNITYF